MRIHSWRLPLLAAFVVLLMISGIGAQAADRPPASEQTNVQTVIKRQLSAFLRDDAGAAFAFASPMIQELFRNPATFLAMVRTGYPQVYRHRRADFGELTLVNGKLVQLVIFTGTDGHKALAVYTMVKDKTGAWRINGCRLLQKGELGA